jgi:hypothetical protein
MANPASASSSLSPISPNAAAAVRSSGVPSARSQPDPKWGHAFWANYGGHAAPKDLAVTARWHVPTDMKVTIDAVLSRSSDRGDGVRAWIHNSRTGVVSEYFCTPQNKKVPTQITTDVKRGDIVSFIVHNETGTDSDSFDWQPQITRADNGELLTERQKRLLRRQPLALRPPKAPAAAQPARAGAHDQQRVHVCGLKLSCSCGTGCLVAQQQDYFAIDTTSRGLVSCGS